MATRRAYYHAAGHTSTLTAAWMSLLWLFCLAVAGVFLYMTFPQVHYIVDNLPDLLRGIFDR